MSKGGSTTSSVTIPEYIEAAAQRNLNKAERISQIGYTPYYGPDVAGFTPMQQAAFQNTADTAGAFGMAAPSSQQDIYGGMAPPTEYAGGVQGYSAAPIYEQSLEALAQNRPGQKAYIDSFFIDPTSGGGSAGNFAPIDYTQYGTMADQAAAERQNQLNIAALQRPSSSTMTQAEMMSLGNIVAPDSNYNPMTDKLTPEQQAYVNDPANTAARIAQEDLNMSITGNSNNNILDSLRGLTNDEPSFADPYRTGSYGGSLVTGGLSGNFTPLPSVYGNVADKIVSSVNPSYAMDKQGEGFAAGGTSTGGYDFDPAAFSSSYGSAPTPAPTPQPYNAAANTAAVQAEAARRSAQRESDSEKSSSGKLVCTAMNKMGLLPDDIYALDSEFGLKVNREDPVLGDGYRLWALPVSEFIKKDTLGARALRAFMRPITLAWAKEMAHQMRPDDYKPNYAGKVIMAIGHPTCRAIGHVFIGGLVKKDV